jgi:transcriptional regulator with XRE-family HTH domain
MTDQTALLLRTKMLGAILRKARLRARLSLKEAAAIVGATSSTFSSYERGRKAISLPELEIFAYHLDIPIPTLISATTHVKEKDIGFDPSAVVSLRQRMIGAMLRKQRTELGMSLRALAEAAGLPTRRVSTYERGERSIPLPELEALAEVMGQSIEDYIDTEGQVGQWATSKQAFELFNQLPADLREFLSKPGNQPYLRMAKRLSEISVEKLRSLAETLLDLTL